VPASLKEKNPNPPPQNPNPTALSLTKAPKLRAKTNHDGAASLMTTQLQNWSHWKPGRVGKREVTNRKVCESIPFSSCAF